MSRSGAMKTRILLLVLSFVSIVSGAHFRGSMITWSVVNATSNPLVLQVLQRHAWLYSRWPCTNADIIAANYTIGSGNLTCVSPCPPNLTLLSSVAVPCTGYNQIEQYVAGEERFLIRVPPNYIFTAVFTSANWFTLVTGGGTWSVAVQINTYMRPSGRYNQAPIVTMLPVIRLRRNITYYIPINVADNDFDRYTCIWSNSSQECGGVCRSLLNLPASTYLNQTSCVLRFTPATVGFYAMAMTVLDFENATSTTPLSRVPIQFIFDVWDSNITCTSPPIYIGDAPANQCIFVAPGQILTMLIRIQVQCPNQTLANIIGVYPTGFTQSSPVSDPYVPSISVFTVYYTANVNQVGQNLFCFAGVDSIGNQGDATCLRFTVQIATSSLNSLYVANATRFPMGLVSQYQSNWTLLYPTGLTYTRPSTDAYVRFKVASTQADYVTYNVVKQSANVAYLSNRLVITSNVVFSSGTSFYIYIDPGVFLPIATCLKDSMGITDPNFWPFYTAVGPSTTTTTSTTTQSTTTTRRNRTVPVIRTLSTTLPPSTTTATTAFVISTTRLLTTVKTITSNRPFPVSGIVGIAIGSLLVVFLIGALSVWTVRRWSSPTKAHNILEEHDSLTESVTQYRVTTRTAHVACESKGINERAAARMQPNIQQNLVSTEC